MAAVGRSVSVTPTFTADWSGARDYWPTLFAEAGLVGAPDLRFLEIGCFEGRATLWLIENVLTDPSSTIAVIDTFQGSPEFPSMKIDGASRSRFDANLAAQIEMGKVSVLVGESQRVLRDLSIGEQFDFVYVDGSHRAPDVLADAVLVWPLLRAGGVVVFDDYEWGLHEPETERPRVAIDAFLKVYARELVVRRRAYQVAVVKL